MKNNCLIILSLLLNLNLSFSQTKSEVEYLLDGITKTENSKEIIKTEQAKKIITYGVKTLPILAEFFTDSTLTKVKSDCHKRNLTKGEIAIIMADNVDRMPYAHLTGIRNCLLEFCEYNPNLVEYYLPWIIQDGLSNFKDKYINWLSGDWIKRAKGKSRRERKMIIKEWKNICR